MPTKHWLSSDEEGGVGPSPKKQRFEERKRQLSSGEEDDISPTPKRQRFDESKWSRISDEEYFNSNPRAEPVRRFNEAFVKEMEEKHKQTISKCVVRIDLEGAETNNFTRLLQNMVTLRTSKGGTMDSLVHKALLRARSPILDKASKAAENGVVHLHHQDHPVAVELYIEWLYNPNFLKSHAVVSGIVDFLSCRVRPENPDVAFVEKCQSLLATFKASYKFGDRVQDDHFKDAVLDLWAGFVTKFGLLDQSLVLTIYRYSDGGSRHRGLALDMASQWPTEKYFTLSKSILAKKCPRFVMDLLEYLQLFPGLEHIPLRNFTISRLGSLAQSMNQEFRPQYLRDNMCRYHEHRKLDGCYANKSALHKWIKKYKRERDFVLESSGRFS